MLLGVIRANVMKSNTKLNAQIANAIVKMRSNMHNKLEGKPFALLYSVSTRVWQFYLITCWLDRSKTYFWYALQVLKEMGLAMQQITSFAGMYRALGSHLSTRYHFTLVLYSLHYQAFPCKILPMSYSSGRLNNWHNGRTFSHRKQVLERVVVLLYWYSYNKITTIDFNCVHDNKWCSQLSGLS